MCVRFIDAKIFGKKHLPMWLLMKPGRHAITPDNKHADSITGNLKVSRINSVTYLHDGLASFSLAALPPFPPEGAASRIDRFISQPIQACFSYVKVTALGNSIVRHIATQAGLSKADCTITFNGNKTQYITCILLYTSCYEIFLTLWRLTNLIGGRTAPLNSKRCILYIYSTNTGTAYFKHGIYSPFFFLFKMQFVS